jgi:hypothetical protein
MPRSAAAIRILAPTVPKSASDTSELTSYQRGTILFFGPPDLDTDESVDCREGGM